MPPGSSGPPHHHNVVILGLVTEIIVATLLLPTHTPSLSGWGHSEEDLPGNEAPAGWRGLWLPGGTEDDLGTRKDRGKE